jgi:hypothetical protein
MDSNVNSTLNHKQIQTILLATKSTTKQSYDDLINYRYKLVNIQQQSQTQSYILFQLKLSIIVFVFWLTLFLLLSHLEVVIFIQKSILNYVIKNFIYTPKLIRLNNYRRKLTNLFFHFNIINLRDSIRSIKQFISTIHISFLNNTSNLNRLRLLIIDLFLFIKNIRSSFGSFIYSVTSNIKFILQLPSKIRDSFLNAKRQIGLFWSQIEQIIQIIRLPIEILALIGKFCKSVAHFLHGLERPKLHKLI